jgi:cobalamin biosynthesis Mg chelatase CobN
MTEKDFAAFKYVIDKEHVDNRVMEILKLKERPHVYSINVSMKTGDRTPNHPSNYVTVKGATSEGSSQSVITLSQALDALYALTKENTRDGLRPMMIYVEAAKHQHEWSKLDEFLRALDTTRLHAIALMGVARCTYSARNVLSEWTAYLERAYAEAQRRFPDQADSLFVGLIP